MGSDDVTSILYTSGTTGPAKGVVLTHSANMALAIANVELMEYTDADVLYTAFPLFHVNAKFTSVVSAMMTGARLVLDDRFSASRFWDDRARARRHLVQLHGVDADDPRQAADRAPTTATTRSTARMARPARRALWPVFEERFGVHLREHYGMTEIGIATHNTREVRRVGSCGRANRFFEVRVADDRRPRGPGRRGRGDPCAAARTGDDAAGVLEATRTPRSRRSATSGSTPATARGWTRTASSTTSTVSRTRSAGAGRTSRRSTSRASSTLSPQSWSPPPTACRPSSEKTT